MSLKKLIKLTTMPDFDRLYLGADQEWEDGERKGEVVWDCDINFQPRYAQPVSGEGLRVLREREQHRKRL